MTNPRYILHANLFEPFVGHQGSGARIEIIWKENVLVVREKTSSQLFLIFLMSLLVVVPLWILLYHAHEIKGGAFGRYILAGTALFTFPFTIKYVHRLLGGRRVEIRPQERAVCFIPSGQTIQQQLRFSQIKQVIIKETDYRGHRVITKNYTVMVEDALGKQYALCTSNRKQDIELPYVQIRKLLALNE